jgi:hypothetical protein
MVISCPRHGIHSSKVRPESLGNVASPYALGLIVVLRAIHPLAVLQSVHAPLHRSE